MPRYDFECAVCHNVIELQKSIHDETAPLCFAPGCDGKHEMERLIGGSTFHLKGLGWAAEGYSKTGID